MKRFSFIEILSGIFESSSKVKLLTAALFIVILPISIPARCAEKPEYPFLAKREARWDELSKKIVPEIIKRNIDIASIMMYLEKAGCSVEVASVSKLGGRQNAGSVKYSWNDKNKDGILNFSEIDALPVLSGEESHSTSKASSELKFQTYMNVFNIFSVAEVKAKKTTNGYTLHLVFTDKFLPQDIAINDSQLKVSKDYRITDWKMKTSLQGQYIKRTFSHKKWHDKWLVVSCMLETPMPDGTIMKEERSDSFLTEANYPVITSSRYKMTFGKGGDAHEVTTELTFKDWKFKKREIPLPVISPEDDSPESGWESEEDIMTDIENIEDSAGDDIWQDDWDD